MKKSMTFVPRQHGMTLVEVMVSLLIFSFGFLGMISMQARAIQISSDAQDRSRAALFANEIVSTMWMQNSTTVAAADYNAWIARIKNTTAGGLPNSSGSITDVNGVITVTITWRAPLRASTSVQASTYSTQLMRL